GRAAEAAAAAAAAAAAGGSSSAAEQAAPVHHRRRREAEAEAEAEAQAEAEEASQPPETTEVAAAAIAAGAEARSSPKVNKDALSAKYIVFTWVLCLVAVATSLKLYYLVKTALALAMSAAYALLIAVVFQENFEGQQNLEERIPGDDAVKPSYQMLALLAVFLGVVVYHARLVEELYSQQRDQVGVMFATIPNFTEFYSEDINKGMECIRLLNEIIVDWDELLDEPRFNCIEKVKTVGASYMAASGLNPASTARRAKERGGANGTAGGAVKGEDGNGKGEDGDPLEHVCALVDFAVAMQQRLEDVNQHSFNSFRLRVGISVGPLVGGVIGARKPVFDIWGNTVNEASRMDSTGKMGHIQVPKDTAAILEARGYTVHLRGLVAVKGKGDMETFYVLGKRAKWASVITRQPSNYNSLAAVVYGMVQAHRRRTVRSKNSKCLRTAP
ncbi:Soluble guanylate cyclase 89Db, partial [Gryllus bimaculatus]